MSAGGPGVARVVLLSGGVGGARFAHGLDRVLPEGALTVVVNTGDDFEHWGLPVSPDLDTVMYTLAGLADVERGWGVSDETFRALEGVRGYGGPTWFALGDRDLATHLMRRQWLAEGMTLSDVTARLSGALGVRTRLLPMSDDPFRTLVTTTSHGTLPFQDWLVRHRAPEVVAIEFEHDDAVPAPGVLDAISAAELVLVAPSNPYVSIDPILALPGVRQALGTRPVVAVSPIVGTRAVKGPLAAMIPSLSGEAPSAEAVARHYDGLLDGFVVHTEDRMGLPGVEMLSTDIIMRDLPGRERLARAALELGAQLMR